MRAVVQVSVTPAGPSIHQIADALRRKAARIFGTAKLFEIELGLGDYAGDAAAQRAPKNFDCDARFAARGNDIEYVDASWLPGVIGLATIAENDFGCVSADCGGNGARRGEPPEMHPALTGWAIDRGEIVQAIGAHQELFGEGLMAVTVTSAIRARTDGVIFGAGGAWSAMLYGLSGKHPVAVIVGAPHRCEDAEHSASGSEFLCGNYLVIDGSDGSDLDAGAYREAHQED